MAKLEQSYQWQGRVDAEEGVSSLRWHQVMGGQHYATSCALVGFECDLGVAANKGRVGAARGPTVIRDALANLAWHGACNLQDAGSVVAEADLPEAQAKYAQLIAQHLDNNAFVIGLGGGHEIAWGSYQGLAQHLASRTGKKIGIVNFDAHFDLRNPASGSSSGTPFRQIAEYCLSHDQSFHYACLGVAESSNTAALFDYAQQTNTQYLLDMDCNLEAAQHLLRPMLQSVDALYVTVCLDAFPASIAPGVSAPSALGISLKFVIDILHWLAQSQAKYGYSWSLLDIAEMNPNFDKDNRTAKVAARLIYEAVKVKFKG